MDEIDLDIQSELYLNYEEIIQDRIAKMREKKIERRLEGMSPNNLDEFLPRHYLVDNENHGLTARQLVKKLDVERDDSC